MKQRRGQLSTVFVYIMAAIVFVVIVVFGYKAITEFVSKGERVAFVSFKADIEEAVRSIASDYGSVVIYNAQNPLRVPGRYERVCFIDVDKSPPIRCDVVLNPIICDAWKTAFDAGGWSASEANVFLEPLGMLPIKVYRLRVDTNSNGVEDSADGGHLCFGTASGRIDIRLEGKGDHTFISAP